MWTGKPTLLPSSPHGHHHPSLFSIIYNLNKLVAYTSFSLQDKHDLLVIPGGAQGAETISKHPSVQELVRRYIEGGKLVGMICAGVLFSFQKIVRNNYCFRQS